MGRKLNDHMSGYDWSQAKGLMPIVNDNDTSPQGAIVPDQNQNWDHIAVVYSKGNTPPEITVQEVSGSVHTVFADGQPVAVVARSGGSAPVASDVLLVERAFGS